MLSQYPSLLLSLAVWADAVVASSVAERSPAEPYAPYTTTCPSNHLIRPANGLNKLESAYVSARRPLASEALKSWLKKTWPKQDGAQLDSCHLPGLAMAMSGGGSKAAGIGAGTMMGLDGRDTANGVSGLLQGMTYLTGLSGGSLALSGVIANNFAQVSTLRRELYDQSFQNPFLFAVENVATISKDTSAKSLAGYPTTLIDIYGRAISYDYIGGPVDGGNAVLWSDAIRQTAFNSHEAPFPIITLTDADVSHGHCTPDTTKPIWEFSPFEFGSWDPAVQGFVPTKYVGTSMSNGAPSTRNNCTVGFDNAGLFAGMSANAILPDGGNCTGIDLNGIQDPLVGLAAQIVLAVPAPALHSPYGIIPNPFKNYGPASGVRANKNLFMLDGGYTHQGIPLLPLLQPQRGVDVIFVIDSQSDTDKNITDGSSLHNTYVAAQALGLSRMPLVPTVEVIQKENLTDHAHFFGCHDPKVTTFIWLPDSTSVSAFSSSNFFFTPAEIDQLFRGSVDMVTQFNDSEWPTCVACAIMHKSLKSLPAACGPCLQKYCWTH